MKPSVVPSNADSARGLRRRAVGGLLSGPQGHRAHLRLAGLLLAGCRAAGPAGPWLPRWAGGASSPAAPGEAGPGAGLPDNVETCFLLLTWSSHVGACIMRMSGFPDFSGLGKSQNSEYIRDGGVCGGGGGFPCHMSSGVLPKSGQDTGQAPRESRSVRRAQRAQVVRGGAGPGGSSSGRPVAGDPAHGPAGG